MERALENYIDELKSDVASRVYSEGEGVSFEDKFTEYSIEVLEAIGKSEGARVLSYVHPNNQVGIDWKINGFCLKDFAKDEDKKPTNQRKPNLPEHNYFLCSLLFLVHVT